MNYTTTKTVGTYSIYRIFLKNTAIFEYVGICLEKAKYIHVIPISIMYRYPFYASIKNESTYSDH